MRFFPLLVFLIPLLSVAADATPKALIQAASNITDGKVALVVLNESDSPRKLVRLDLKSRTVQTLHWPAKVGQEEVLGLIQLPDSLLLISQWTSGDPKQPKVFRYFYERREWRVVGEIPCLSFDKLSLDRNGLAVVCEATSEVSASERVLKVPFSTKGKQRFTFPILDDRQGDLDFKLIGPLFKWTALNISGKPFAAEHL